MSNFNRNKWLASHDFGTISDVCLPIKPLVSTWQDLLLIETTLPFALCSALGGVYVAGRLISRRATFEATDVFYLALSLCAVVVGGIGTCLFGYTTLAQASACPLATGIVGCRIQQTIIWWLGTFSGLLQALITWHAAGLTYTAFRWRSSFLPPITSRRQYESVARNIIVVCALLIVSAVFTALPVHYGSIFAVGRQQHAASNVDSDGLTLSCEEEFFHVDWLRTLTINVATTLPAVLVLILGSVFCVLYISVLRQSSRVAYAVSNDTNSEWVLSADRASEQLATRLAGLERSHLNIARRTTAPRAGIEPSAPSADEELATEPKGVSRLFHDEIEPARDVPLNSVTRPVYAAQFSSVNRASRMTDFVAAHCPANIASIKQRIAPVPWLVAAFLLTWLPYFIVLCMFMKCTWLLSDEQHDEAERGSPSAPTQLDKTRLCMSTTPNLADARQWTTVVWLADQALVVLIIAFKYPRLRRRRQPAAAAFDQQRPNVTTGFDQYSRRRRWLGTLNHQLPAGLESSSSSRRSSNISEAAHQAIIDAELIHRGDNTGWRHLPTKSNAQVVEVTLTPRARF